MHGRPAVEKRVAIRRRPLTSDDSRTGVQCTKQFNRRHNASSDCCRSGLHLKKVSTLHNRTNFTNVQLLTVNCHWQ